MIRSVPARAALLTTLILTVATAPAAATRIDVRTLRVSTAISSASADGASANPALSAAGSAIAFDTAATTIVEGDGNGAIRDVVLLDAARGIRLLVSSGPDGSPADNASTDPVLSAGGTRVAFTSLAANLVPGDGNGVSDVFYRDVAGTVVLASATADGRPGNGASSNADLSDDGRFLVFESTASDLVANDTNRVSDVFLRDLQTGFTRRVSLDHRGLQAKGASTSPAISGNGRVVSFESTASNLVPRDTNRTADVFVRDTSLDVTERVSIGARGAQQNRAVAAPFHMVSDLDRDGRLVVFESEASNLTPNDENRSADIFLHDRNTLRTRLVSASSANVQGNNDSVSPVLSPSGRYLAFQSFATNLAPDDATGPDVFVRDLRLRATTNATVTADGRRRGPELAGSLLQRPSISASGRTAAFVSSAPGMVAADADRLGDVFVRLLTPPRTTIARRSSRSVTFGADDAAATRFLCRVDRLVPFPCDSTVPLAQPGSRLVVRAMGPGLLPDDVGVRVRARRDRVRPRLRITRIPTSRAQRTIRGTASDLSGSGVQRVLVAVTYYDRTKRCSFLDGSDYRRTSDCNRRAFQVVTGHRGKWRFVLPRRLPASLVVFAAQAIDRAGNRSKVVEKLTLLR